MPRPIGRMSTWGYALIAIKCLIANCPEMLVVFGIVRSTHNLNLFRMEMIVNAHGKEKRNGKWKEFNKHGMLVAEGTFCNDLKQGTWKYYYNTGELAIQENYLNGKMHGNYTSYHLNGRVMSEGRYENDSREGDFNIYNENGDLIKVMLFANNTLMSEKMLNRIAENSVAG